MYDESMVFDETDSIAVAATDISEHLDAVNAVEEGVDMIEIAIKNINDQDTVEKMEIAIESAALHLEQGFSILGIPGMTNKYLVPAMESNASDKHLEFLRSLESMKSDLIVANEGLITDTLRSIGDWWEYGKEAYHDQVEEAKTLLMEIEDLPTSPTSATVRFPGADNVCYGGSLRAKDIAAGYKKLNNLQEKFESDFKGLFASYLREVSKMFQQTASSNDWWANRTKTGVAGIGAFVLGNWYLMIAGGLVGVVWLTALYKSKTNQDRIRGVKELMDASMDRLRDFIADYRRTFGQDRISGDRKVNIEVQPNGKFDGVSIVKTGKLKSKEKSDTLTIADMQLLLETIIDGESNFKHRYIVHDELMITIEKEVVNLYEAGKEDKREAIRSGANRVKGFGLKLYWKPVSDMSRLQLSVNRSLFSIVRANMKAY